MEELRHQSALHPLLEHFVASEVDRTVDRLIYFDLPSGEFGLVVASVVSGCIACLHSLVILPNTSQEQRWALWQTGINWAMSQSPAGIQIDSVCHKEDQVILAGLGYPVTTEIMVLEVDVSDRREPLDPAIRRVSNVHEPSGLECLIRRTLVNSLDLPESIPLHAPEDLLQTWIGGSPDHEVLLLVAASGEELVGLIVGTFGRYADNLTGYQINYLGVAADHRRQGWGSRLLNQFLQRIHADAIRKVSVFTDQRNLPAIQLYQRFGFQELEQLRMPMVFRCCDRQNPRTERGPR